MGNILNSLMLKRKVITLFFKDFSNFVVKKGGKIFVKINKILTTISAANLPSTCPCPSTVIS